MADALPEMMLRRTGFLLARAGMRGKDLLNQRLHGHGIHVRHYAVLAMLMENPAAQVAMADRLCIDRTSMVALLDELEARGYVRRTTNPQDRRMHVVQITAEGEALVRAGEQCARQAETELMASLTAGEKEDLHRILLKMLG
jgi:DNA-binding MarR family transcriptional regulator